MPLAETPATLACDLPRNADGEPTPIHDLRLEVCCGSAESSMVTIDEWTRVGDTAQFEVPALDTGLYYAACIHSATPVGSPPWYEPIPLPEPSGGLLAGVLLLVMLARRRR